MNFNDKRIKTILKDALTADKIRMHKADLAALQKLSNDLSLTPRAGVEAKAAIFYFHAAPRTKLVTVSRMVERRLQRYVKLRGKCIFALQNEYSNRAQCKTIYLY